ncbi:hypothetical protein ACVILJ_000148 [Bradyrhizobium diazoefficiens]
MSPKPWGILREFGDQEHTPAKGENPVFGGYEVGIGFSGTCTAGSGELEGIALAGKRSLRLAALLKLMRRAACTSRSAS